MIFEWNLKIFLWNNKLSSNYMRFQLHLLDHLPPLLLVVHDLVVVVVDDLVVVVVSIGEDEARGEDSDQAAEVEQVPSNWPGIQRVHQPANIYCNIWSEYEKTECLFRGKNDDQDAFDEVKAVIESVLHATHHTSLFFLHPLLQDLIDGEIHDPQTKPRHDDSTEEHRHGQVLHPELTVSPT